jgi:hypothetical protein
MVKNTLRYGALRHWLIEAGREASDAGQPYGREGTITDWEELTVELQAVLESGDEDEDEDEDEEETT